MADRHHVVAFRSHIFNELLHSCVAEVLIESLDTTPELELHSTSAAQPAPGRGRDRFDVPVLHGRSMGACLTLLDITETSSSTSRTGWLQETHGCCSWALC